MEKRKALCYHFAVINIFVFILISIQGFAAVEGRWLSVTSILISDGETKLLFDACYSRPSLLNFLNITDYKSNEKLVEKVLRKLSVEKIDGVFVTHEHFDHAVDATAVAIKTGATLYASQSMQRIAKAYNDPSLKLEPLKTVTIGKFKISHFSRNHDKIFQQVEFLPGEVSKKFDFSFYDYKVGESWIYLVEHPEGTILIDSAAASNLDILPSELKKIDVLFQGVANRKSDGSLLDGYVKTLKPKKFIATHFDNFMLSFRPGRQLPMGNVKVEGLKESFEKHYPDTQFILPSYADVIPLF